MKTCLIYANCQTRLLIKFLKSSEEFNKNYKIISTPLVQDLLKTKKVLEDEIISQVDLFIYQPVRKEHGELSSEHTLTRLPSKAISISFPSLYFKGYHPQECKNSYSYFINPANLWCPLGLFPHGDTNIISLLKEGKKEKEIIEIVSNENFYQKLCLTSNLNSTLAEMRNRETEFSIDIKVSDFIQENYQKHYLFYTPQHPSDVIGLYVVNQILSVLGFPAVEFHFVNKNQEKVGILDTFQLPVYPSVVKNLELTFFSPEELYKNSYFCQEMSFTEYVSCYIRYHDTSNSLSLSVYYHFLSINSETKSNIQDAINYENQAISISTDQAFMYERLGYLLEKSNQLPEAKIAYEKAISLNNNWPSFYFSLGNVLLKQSNLEDAVVVFSIILATKVKDSNTRKQLKIIVQKIYDDLMPMKSSNFKLPHQSYQILAKLLYRLGYYEKAKIVLNNLIELQPDDCLAYVEFGKMLQRQGIFNEETKFYFQKATDLNPRSLPARIGLATYFQSQGLIEEAISQWKTAYEVSATRAGGYPELELTKLYIQKGDSETATLWYQKCLLNFKHQNAITTDEINNVKKQLQKLLEQQKKMEQ